MDPVQQQGIFGPPETPKEPMEFLSRSWSVSALELSKSLSSSQVLVKAMSDAGAMTTTIPEEEIEEPPLVHLVTSVSGNPFSFASSETCQLVMERIMSQSQQQQQQDINVSSPRTSGRLSHSSGPLNGSLTDSPPVSPPELDDNKFCRLNNQANNNNPYRFAPPPATGAVAVAGGKTVGRWLKDRREKKKEETRAQNAQLHAAISVAGLAAAVAAIAAATAATSGSGKDEQMAKTDMAMASAATLVAAQCVESAEAMGAEREHLASVIISAVNVRSAGDIMTLTAAAATALRGAATLKARALKEVRNVTTVIPLDKARGGRSGGGVDENGSNGSSNSSFSGELPPDQENFLGICSRELLARGSELLKRTRQGDLHWKIVSVYINKLGQVMLKMKSSHVAGTITKKKKNVVLEVLKDIPAWPGRHLLEGGDDRHYFALRTVTRGVVEFECRNKREYDVWTQGVSRLLTIAAEKRNNNTRKS